MATEMELIAALSQHSTAVEARLHCVESALVMLLAFQAQQHDRDSRIQMLRHAISLAGSSSTHTAFLEALDPDWKPATRQ